MKENSEFNTEMLRIKMASCRIFQLRTAWYIFIYIYINLECVCVCVCIDLKKKTQAIQRMIYWWWNFFTTFNCYIIFLSQPSIITSVSLPIIYLTSSVYLFINQYIIISLRHLLLKLHDEILMHKTRTFNSYKKSWIKSFSKALVHYR